MKSLFARLSIGIPLAIAGVAVLVTGFASPTAWAEEEADPAEIALGERLFLETRFAQHFFARSGGNVNARNVPGDPSLELTVRANAPDLVGAFAGQSMNCRACHLVDDKARELPAGGGVERLRTYADFARRSPIPERGDGVTVTLRNSPSLVGIRRRAKRRLLHLDGEFASLEKLVFDTLTGRNYGWLPNEQDQAVRHIANVIRNDDGRGELAHEFGGKYSHVLRGERVDDEFRLPRRFRVRMRASDRRIVRAVSRIISVYVGSLAFHRDDRGRFSGSAYDVFLAKNRLPRAPAAGERSAAYAGRLRRALARRKAPRYVDGRDGRLDFHDHGFRFGPLEKRGLEVFLATPETAPGSTSGVGNCVACHIPPTFTDHRFHNTGATQVEYDALHGDGAFGAIEIPGLAERNADPSRWLPPIPARPDGLGPFASVPAAQTPGVTDLGAWNVLFDPARQLPQRDLARRVTPLAGDLQGDDALLAGSVGAFKTPMLRALGESGPYMHHGRLDTFEDVLRFYADVADLARADRLRAGDAEIAAIAIDDSDVKALAALLRALDKDYD